MGGCGRWRGGFRVYMDRVLRMTNLMSTELCAGINDSASGEKGDGCNYVNGDMDDVSGG